MSSYRPVQTGHVGPLRPMPVFGSAMIATAAENIDVQINNPPDDGDYNGGFDNADPEITVGNNGTTKKGYFLFRGTGIPQGVTITDAYLIITSSANLNSVTVNLVLNAADEDNPAVPGNKADAEDRPRTAAQVAWSNVEAWTADTEYQSPDMTTIIQELVDRAGFASDNVLIFVEDNGSTANASRKGHSYNGDPAKAAQLFVSWAAIPPVPMTCDELVLSGLYSAMPASEIPARIYLPSNGMAIYRDRDVQWEQWGATWPLTIVDDSGFSWDNQGAASVDTTHGPPILSVAGLAGDNLRTRYKAAPSTPYTITALLLTQFNWTNWDHLGILWRESSSGKIAALKASGNGALYSSKYNSSSSFSANYVTYSYVQPYKTPNLMWLRCRDDGVNRECYWGMDGRNFHLIHQVGRTDFLTADQVGWFVKAQYSTTWDCAAALLSWEVS